ncbi:hypothetical protein Dimus_023781 [Dionaea muscipula]
MNLFWPLLAPILFCAASTSSSPMLCHDDEKSALIQFKQSFSIVFAASVDTSAYPKTLLWKPTGNGSDCCIWDGVECNQHNSHVVGLDLSSSFLDGRIPHNSSLFELVHLRSLNLSDNNFKYSLQIPSWLDLLMNLEYLNMSQCNFETSIPASLGKLSKLTYLDLSFNHLIGKVPPSLTNLSQLSYLDLGHNNLDSEIPISIGKNNFNGPIHFETFLGYTNLQALHLTNIDLIMPTSTSHNNSSSYYHQFVSLILEGCNLVRFLDFLHNQTRFSFLGLGNNYIQGPVPMPPPSLVIYDVGGNDQLRGEIPTTICNATSLQILRLSLNRLSGRIPLCLFDSSNHMTYLNLGDNLLLGMIPKTFTSSCKLKVIGLGNNKLEGGIPRSLANCTSLVSLNLSSNNISNTFPIWLSTLLSLQSLDLQANILHGPLPVQFRLGFPILHILQLSHNQFIGEIFNELFNDLNCMQKPCQTLPGVEIAVSFTVLGVSMSLFLTLSLPQKYKGHINNGISLSLPVMTNLSRNRLVGMIPDSIGNLVALHFCTKPISSSSSSATVPSISSCRDDERTALLRFKLSFSIDRSASSDPSSYAKTGSWKSTSTDCCVWDGVECDEESRHVTGVDLSSSYLSGSISPNSSLFELLHIQSLNLADNDFRYSVIPPELARLSNLRYLNLSGSSFSGHVPTELSNLSHLITLDLSSNVLLKFQEPRLSRVLGNLTGLENLRLSHVDVSSPIPGAALGNLTSLRTLRLLGCGLQGPMENAIFLLPQLRLLNLNDNQELVGVLPEFQSQNSKLEVLLLMNTGFYGKIPPSIGNLSSLTEFMLFNSSFHGSIPYSFGQLSQLTIIDFSTNNFEGSLPASLGNLTQLTYLGFGDNKLVGQVPSTIANLTKLTSLELSSNGLQGSIPAFISGLENLQLLDLLMNDFQGPVGFDVFLKHKQLQILQLSGVDLILAGETGNSTSSYPQFVFLVLESCNLTRFPDILYNQTNLQVLDLGMNNIRGPLLPLPNVVEYYLAHNELSGEIPSRMCNATSLYSLILSYNGLSGRIPPCLFSLSSSLMILSLDQNNLEGMIPETFTSTCKLRVLNLNNNGIQGPVPRSLAKCQSLVVLDLGSNILDGSFPIWLAGLPELQALALGSNILHGSIPSSFGRGFPSLHIIDLSNNNLGGNLPDELFLNRSAMEVGNQGQTQTGYLTVTVPVSLLGLTMEATYPLFITLRYKGNESPSTKILKIFTSIDLSSNSFQGNIPVSIVNLVGLQSLNLSHNKITGSIPSSMRELSNLESLDLSNNFLSGDIPQQLAELTFLEIFDVSHNQLTGSIPQGNQFGTFSNDSFEGNRGLCGSPLSKRCVNSETPPAQADANSENEDDDNIPSFIDWIIISMGYLSGLVVGVIFGSIFMSKKHEWFVETFGRRRRNKRKGKRKAPRN